MQAHKLVLRITDERTAKNLLSETCRQSAAVREIAIWIILLSPPLHQTELFGTLNRILRGNERKWCNALRKRSDAVAVVIKELCMALAIPCNALNDAAVMRLKIP